MNHSIKCFIENDFGDTLCRGLLKMSTFLKIILDCSRPENEIILFFQFDQNVDNFIYQNVDISVFSKFRLLFYQNVDLSLEIKKHLIYDPPKYTRTGSPRLIAP